MLDGLVGLSTLDNLSLNGALYQVNFEAIDASFLQAI